MPRTIKIIVCVRAGPTDTGKIAKNNLYKAAGLWATLEIAISRITGADILGLCRKLPAASVLATQYPLSQLTVFWDLQLHGGRAVALASVTAPTLLKELSYAAANNAVKVYLLPQADPDPANTKIEFTQQQQGQQGQQHQGQPGQQGQQQLGQQVQPQRAQVLIVNRSTTLLGCVSQLPAGRVLLVDMPVTQVGIDLGKDRAKYATMAAVVSLDGWLDGIVGAVTTRESNFNSLALCLGPGTKVYVMPSVR